MKNKQIAKKMFSDVYSYKEYIEEMIDFYMNSKPEEKKYWTDWFEGKDMKSHN